MIKLIENCTLLASYESMNDSFENICLQERLYPSEEINQGTDVIQILIEEKLDNGSLTPNSLTSAIGRRFVQNLKHDGKYTYFSVRLWTLDGWNYERNKYLNLYSDKKMEYPVEIPKDIFYLHGSKNNLHLYRNGEQVEVEDLVDELLSASENWGCLELQRKDIFALCHFEKCVAELQKESVLRGLKFAGTKMCVNSAELDEQRDFMFITLDLLKSLVEQERYEQAQQLLDDVSTKCGTICKTTTTTKNGCGCNR